MLRLSEVINLTADRVASTDPNDIVFIPNIESAISTVCKSLRWRDDDLLVLLGVESESTRACAAEICQRYSIQVLELPLLPTTVEQIELIKEKASQLCKAKLIIIEHVSRRTGQINRVSQTIPKLHDACPSGCVFVDGADALGQVEVQIPRTQADFYFGSLDKWLFGAQGVGFLYARPSHHKSKEKDDAPQNLIHPLTTSYFKGQGFEKEFSYFGLLDFSVFTAMKQAYECSPLALYSAPFRVVKEAYKFYIVMAHIAML